MIVKSDTARNAACNAIVDLVDLGSTDPSGSVSIFDSDSTLLVSLPMSNPAYLDATSNGVSLANTVTQGVVLATGVASDFSVSDRDGSNVFDGSVTTVGGGGDMELTTINFIETATVNIIGASFTVPL